MCGSSRTSIFFNSTMCILSNFPYYSIYREVSRATEKHKHKYGKVHQCRFHYVQRVAAMHDKYRDTHAYYHWNKAKAEQRAQYAAERAQNLGKEHQPERQCAAKSNRVIEHLCHILEHNPFCYSVAHEQEPENNTCAHKNERLSSGGLRRNKKELFYFSH